jgi:hypothetical protein
MMCLTPLASLGSRTLSTNFKEMINVIGLITRDVAIPTYSPCVWRRENSCFLKILPWLSWEANVLYTGIYLNLEFIWGKIFLPLYISMLCVNFQATHSPRIGDIKTVQLVAIFPFRYYPLSPTPPAFPSRRENKTQAFTYNEKNKGNAFPCVRHDKE